MLPQERIHRCVAADETEWGLVQALATLGQHFRMLSIRDGRQGIATKRSDAGNHSECFLAMVARHSNSSPRSNPSVWTVTGRRRDRQVAVISKSWQQLRAAEHCTLHQHTSKTGSLLSNFS